MQSYLTINEMLHQEITKLTDSLIPPGFEGDNRSIRHMQDSIAKVLDELGQQSALEQGLKNVVTTAAKFRTADKQTIYILKDAEAYNGTGEPIGMLKVGPKHLFLHDVDMCIREVEPLCVLDFFVRKDRQRHGLGRHLFDHMLKDQGLEPRCLAVDGPSLAMQAFLGRNYGLTNLIRQSNNFAVSPTFFDNLTASGSSNASKSMASSIMTPAKGRYSAHRPTSLMSSVIHGTGGHNHEREMWPAHPVNPVKYCHAPTSIITKLIHDNNKN